MHNALHVRVAQGGTATPLDSILSENLRLGALRLNPIVRKHIAPRVVACNEAYVSLVHIPVVMLTLPRIACYRGVTTKLAAYQIVLIEPLLKGVKWEGRNVVAQTPVSRKADSGVSWLVGKLRYWDFFLSA